MNNDRIAGMLVGGLLVAVIMCDPMRDFAKRTLTGMAKEAGRQLNAAIPAIVPSTPEPEHKEE